MPNFELGKYVVYIVPAYAITFVIWAAMVGETLLRARRWKREVERLEALKTAKKKT
jgi:heme exporter protein D